MKEKYDKMPLKDYSTDAIRKRWGKRVLNRDEVFFGKSPYREGRPYLRGLRP